MTNRDMLHFADWDTAQPRWLAPVGLTRLETVPIPVATVAWSPRCECGGWTSFQGGCFVCDRIYGLADDPNDIGLGCDGDDDDPDDEPLGCDVCGLAPCLCYGEVDE